METIEKISVTEAARIMGVAPRFIYAGLQEGRFPFGQAVKFTRWSYWISKDKFFKYLEAN